MEELPDDFVEFLASEARSATAAVHQFRESADKQSGIHLFVEGDDDGGFYCAQVKRLTGKTAYHYICGGKSEVLTVLEELRPEVGNNIIFIVDRDHQDFVSENRDTSDAYVTDFYSFESYFVTPEVISRFVTEKLNIPATNALHASVVQAFSASEKSFAYVLRPYMAFVLAAREAKIKLNLNNVNLDDLVTISKNGVFSLRRDRRAKACRSINIGDNDVILLGSVLKWRRRLSMCSRLNWMRGKYYLWCVFRFLNLVSKGILEARKSLKLKKSKMPEVLGNFEVFRSNMLLPVAPTSFAALVEGR